MKINQFSIGDKIFFVGCDSCSGKKVCFFCKKGVKTEGTIVSQYFDFAIQTVEVKVKGSSELLEVTQADLEDPDFIKAYLKSKNN